MAFCSNCGSELTGGSFCANCGAPVGGAPAGTAQQQAQAVPQGLRSRDLIFKALAVLKKKPIRLWGVSLMCELLTVLAAFLGVLPIISIPIVFVLEAGMTAVYLAGYRGQEVNTDALFAGFPRFFKVAGGMGWMALWVFIWGLIPVVGPVFAVIKAYSYRFVPYIIIQDPEISATEALRLSVKKTEGFKGKMFLADFLIAIACVVAVLLLTLLSRIPYAGVLFAIILVVLALFLLAGLPLLMGLVSAAGYEEIFVKEGKGDEA